MLYEDFFSSGCDWKKSTIYRSVTNTFENRRTGKRKWLTRQQMLPFFDNDPAVVDAVILRKKSDPELCKNEIRPHPENPSVMQYLVLVEDEEEATERDRILDKFIMSTSSRGGGDDPSGSEDEDGESDGEGSTRDSPEKKKSKKEKKEKKNKKGKGKKGQKANQNKNWVCMLKLLEFAPKCVVIG